MKYDAVEVKKLQGMIATLREEKAVLMKERDDNQRYHDICVEGRGHDRESFNNAVRSFNQMTENYVYKLKQLDDALVEIVEKWVPALLRDAREADKTDCNAQSIRGLIIRTLPGRNFK